MPQDVRASFISTLNGLSVSGTTLNAAYWSQRYSTALPAVFVRELTADYSTDIGNSALLGDGVYDLAITCVGSSSVTPETFLGAAETAIQSALAAVKNNLGGAYGVRLINTRDLEAVNEDGVLVYFRVLTYRAHSAS